MTWGQQQWGPAKRVNCSLWLESCFVLFSFFLVEFIIIFFVFLNISGQWVGVLKRKKMALVVVGGGKWASAYQDECCDMEGGVEFVWWWWMLSSG